MKDLSNLTTFFHLNLPTVFCTVFRSWSCILQFGIGGRRLWTRPSSKYYMQDSSRCHIQRITPNLWAISHWSVGFSWNAICWNLQGTSADIYNLQPQMGPFCWSIFLHGQHLCLIGHGKFSYGPLNAILFSW